MNTFFGACATLTFIAMLGSGKWDKKVQVHYGDLFILMLFATFFL